jgi:progressive ankylosis protein
MNNTTHESNNLSYSGLLRLFLPLSLSDIILVVSGPLIAAILGRLPDVRVQLAALGVAQSLELLTEAPITMMLHAGTALAGNPTAYRTLGRLQWLWSGLITLGYALAAFTPLYWTVTRVLMGLPAGIAEAARPAFAVMMFSAAAVGHRRYMQGQLIYHKRSRDIMIAGLFRLATLTVTLLVGARSGLSGAVVAGIALFASVTAEAVAVTWFSRRVRRILAAQPPAPRPSQPGSIPTKFRGLFQWYLPLVGTQVLVVVISPMLTAGISRAGLAAVSLAAWPVAWSTVKILSNGTRMVQQLTITLVRDEQSRRMMRNFSLGIGCAFSGLLALLAFSPLAPLYLERVIGLRGDLVAITRPVLMLAAVYPLQVAMQNWMQGLLVRTGRTGSVNLAATVGGCTTMGLMFAGALLWQLPGAPLAAAASLVGNGVEILCLWRFSEPTPSADRGETPRLPAVSLHESEQMGDR